MPANFDTVTSLLNIYQRRPKPTIDSARSSTTSLFSLGSCSWVSHRSSWRYLALYYWCCFLLLFFYYIF